MVQMGGFRWGYHVGDHREEESQEQAVASSCRLNTSRGAAAAATGPSGSDWKSLQGTGL